MLPLMFQDILLVPLCLLALGQRNPVLEGGDQRGLLLVHEGCQQGRMDGLTAALRLLGLLGEGCPSLESSLLVALVCTHGPLAHGCHHALVRLRHRNLRLSLILVHFIAMTLALISQVSLQLLLLFLNGVLHFAIVGTLLCILLPVQESRGQYAFGIPAGPLCQRHVHRLQLLLRLGLLQGPFAPDLVDRRLETFCVAQHPLIRHQLDAIVGSLNFDLVLVQLLLVL
mmetsp:Transcript_37274/g.89113  ORF Transcript_37274/g.89113 Transcript_37274/m.89113 type:complete len:227 (-) Transcript_37274:2107-2787(-)